MTYLDEAFEAISRERGGAVAGWLSTAKIIEIAEPFIRADERSKLPTFTQIRDVWTRVMADPGAFVTRGIDPHPEPSYANDLEDLIDWQFRALHAALVSHPTPDGPASPVLGDEERERLAYIARDLEAHFDADPDGPSGLDKDVAFLRKLAQGEERDA